MFQLQDQKAPPNETEGSPRASAGDAERGGRITTHQAPTAAAPSVSNLLLHVSRTQRLHRRARGLTSTGSTTQAGLQPGATHGGEVWIERSGSGLKTVQSSQRGARKQQQLYHKGWGCGGWGSFVCQRSRLRKPTGDDFMETMTRKRAGLHGAAAYAGF